MSAPALSTKTTTVEADLEALLARMRDRLYPETIPVLVSYWLKTVYHAGHKRSWWKEMHERLELVLAGRFLDSPSRQALEEVRAWIEQNRLLTGKTPAVLPPRNEPFRTNLSPERLASYTARLLNQWLSAEVARLLVDDNEEGGRQAEGIPVLAIGKALERLIVRDRLSPGSLDMLLRPGLFSPRDVYPRDAEMLRDVVLAMLGRTEAPVPPVMPATLLGVAAGSPLPADYAEAVRHAYLVDGEDGEEVHVPITAAEGLEILKGDLVRIASIIVTMDGRWWESESLESGDDYSVVYRPCGRLRIDDSADHAKLHVPAPNTRLDWGGPVDFSTPIELFGREWHISSCETDSERTWLHLVFSHSLAVTETQPALDDGIPRPRTAAVDIAWAAFENALASAIFQESREPLEQLRRSEFIPIGRALFELAEMLKSHRLSKREALETQLRAIRYLQAEVSLEYGRVPWRVLPASLRATLRKGYSDPALAGLLTQVFEDAPASKAKVPSQAA